MDVLQFFYSQTDEYLGFQIYAIMNKAAISICI